MTRRRVGLTLMAAFFALLSVSAWMEAIQSLLGSQDDPLVLELLQVSSGTTALVTAVGSWRAARWAPWAAVAYGIITGGMAAGLGPILGLPADARPGLVGGGVVILGIGLACAWYLRRTTAPTDGAPR